MLNFLLQLQLLLAALSAFLPLVPEEHRVRAGEILDVVAKVLSAGGSIASNVDDLAVKLAAIRAEVEAMQKQMQEMQKAQGAAGAGGQAGGATQGLPPEIQEQIDAQMKAQGQ